MEQDIEVRRNHLRMGTNWLYVCGGLVGYPSDDQVAVLAAAGARVVDPEPEPEPTEAQRTEAEAWRYCPRHGLNCGGRGGTWCCCREHHNLSDEDYIATVTADWPAPEAIRVAAEIAASTPAPVSDDPLPEGVRQAFVLDPGCEPPEGWEWLPGTGHGANPLKAAVEVRPVSVPDTEQVWAEAIEVVRKALMAKWADKYDMDAIASAAHAAGAHLIGEAASRSVLREEQADRT